MNLNLKIGLGTYYPSTKGPVDEFQMKNSMRVALENGIRYFDTAHNYANGLAEKNLSEVIYESNLENINVYAKIGFANIPAEVKDDNIIEMIILNQYSSLNIEDIKLAPQKSHFLKPEFLIECLETTTSRFSKNNIKAVLIHNPETQLIKLTRKKFEKTLENAFAVLENAFKKNKIHGYGVATWQSFFLNPDEHFYISIEWLSKIAKRVGGKENGFKTIMFPLNPNFFTASTIKNQPVNNTNMQILDAAHKLQLEVNITSPFNQGIKSKIEKNICMDFLETMYLNPKIHKIFTTMWSNRHLLENIKVAKSFYN